MEGVLRAVAQSASRMDASAAHSHQLVAEIYTFASEKIFVADRLDPARYEDVRQLFERAREAEDDTHYVYQGVLKRYEKRSKENLTVAEDAADLDVVAGWRRKYIHKVREFKDHVVNLEDYLSGRSTPPQQILEPGSGHGSG